MRFVIAAISSSLIALTPFTMRGQPPARPGNESVCPSASPTTGRVVMKPFQQKRLTWFRRQYRLGQVKHQQIMVLKSPSDSRFCEALNAKFSGGAFDLPTTTRTYYRARTYFFASFADVREGTSDAAFKARLYVLDTQLRPFATIAPRLGR